MGGAPKLEKKKNIALMHGDVVKSISVKNCLYIKKVHIDTKIIERIFINDNCFIMSTLYMQS